MSPSRSTFPPALEGPKKNDCDQYTRQSEKGRDATAPVADHTRYADDCVHFGRSSAAWYSEQPKPVSSVEQTRLLFNDGNAYQEVTVPGFAQHSCRRQGSTAPNSQALAVDLENCRLSLKTAFERCQDRSFSHACFAISCVLNSRRPLHTIEISIAITLLVEEYDIYDTDTEGEEVELNSWLEFCGAVLYEDRSGLVHFTADAMPTFISAFRIRGIDASHTTIATACLVQTDVDRNIQVGTKKARWARSAFSAYAAQHRQYHCAKADQSALSLRAESLKSRAVVNRRHHDPSPLRENFGQGMRPMEGDKQPCIDDDSLSISDDWVML